MDESIASRIGETPVSWYSSIEVIISRILRVTKIFNWMFISSESIISTNKLSKSYLMFLRLLDSAVVTLILVLINVSDTFTKTIMF